jgi:hypothetical protein
MERKLQEEVKNPKNALGSVPDKDVGFRVNSLL